MHDTTSRVYAYSNITNLAGSPTLVASVLASMDTITPLKSFILYIGVLHPYTTSAPFKSTRYAFPCSRSCSEPVLPEIHERLDTTSY